MNWRPDSFNACTFAVTLVLFCATLARPQAPPPSPDPASSPASISGVVVSRQDGSPLLRASVVLQPHTSGLTAFSDTTDDKGRFSFPNVQPGVYEIGVTRDGFLSSSTGWLDAFRFPPVFTLRPGAVLNGLTFRLFPWCVISGQVTFENADPAVNAEVALYRDQWFRGRHVIEIAARATTDDRGNYRLYNIPPGTYFLSAEWGKPAPLAGAVEEPRRDAKGQLLPDETYAVTFYPSEQKLTDAAPIHLGYGGQADFMDIVLGVTPTVRIAGHVSSGVTGRLILKPGITLRRVGANNAVSVAAAVTLNLDNRGGFELSGVTPGTYELVAESDEDGRRLTGHRLITAGQDSISNVELLASPPSKWSGEIRAGDTEPFPPGALTSVTVSLEPRDDLATPASAQAGKDGAFTLEVSPGETYDLFVKNLPEGVYLASARAGADDRLANGVSLSPGAAPEPIELVFSRAGAEVTGVVLNPDLTVAPGVNVDLVPDPPAGRYQNFQTGYSDEYGNFHLNGIAPGKYLLMAWAGEAPCDVSNPQDLPACEAAGVQVTFVRGQPLNVTLRLASPPK